MLKVLDEKIRQLVPQLALPVIFECEKVVLDIIRCLFALLGQQIGDRVNVHGGGGGGVSVDAPEMVVVEWVGARRVLMFVSDKTGDQNGV